MPQFISPVLDDMNSPSPTHDHRCPGSVVERQRNYWIDRCRTDVDYIQPHPVPVVYVNTNSQLLAPYYYLNDVDVTIDLQWTHIVYSEAYGRFVPRYSMIHPRSTLVPISRRDGRYYSGDTEVEPMPGQESEVEQHSNPDHYLRALVYSHRLRAVRNSTTTNSTTTTSKESIDMASAEQKLRKLMGELVATRNVKQAESLIQCGLEFEYHRLNGKKRGELQGEVDEEKLRMEVDRAIIRNAGTKSLLAYIAEIAANDSWGGKGIALIAQGIAAGGATDFSAIEGKLRTDLEEGYANATNSLRKVIADQILKSSTRRASILKDNGIPGWDSISEFTEMGEDGSVEGGEIRTLGPQSVSRFLQVAKVLSLANFTVAENTSFHIHLSIKGIKHSYGQRFQAEMYAYLMRNLHRMPDPVRKRLIHEKGAKQYAKISLSKDKYSAVHFHPQGTWEFRLFGNVQKYDEMLKCLTLAYEALRHAYAVKLGESKSLIGMVSADKIQEVLNKIASAPEKFFDQLATDAKLTIESGAA